MPTGARAFAGVWMAILAYAVSELMRLYMIEQAQITNMSRFAASMGFGVGWGLLLGQKKLRSIMAAASHGFTAAVVLGISATFLLAFAQVLRPALIDGKAIFLLDSINRLVEGWLINLQYFLEPAVGSTLIIGGIIGGLLTKLAAAMWN